jgi:hypothetical protein
MMSWHGAPRREVRMLSDFVGQDMGYWSRDKTMRVNDLPDMV